MIRALAVAAVAAAIYPAFSSLAGVGAELYNAEAVKLASFPALVGAVAALVGRKREPLPSAAISAAAAMVVVDLADTLWRCAAAGDAGAPPLGDWIAVHAARGIVAFFIGLAGGAIATFVSAFAAKPQPAGGRRRLAIIAGALVAGLWVCYGAARLLMSSG